MTEVVPDTQQSEISVGSIRYNPLVRFGSVRLPFLPQPFQTGVSTDRFGARYIPFCVICQTSATYLTQGKKTTMNMKIKLEIVALFCFPVIVSGFSFDKHVSRSLDSRNLNGKPS